MRWPWTRRPAEPASDPLRRRHRAVPRGCPARRRWAGRSCRRSSARSPRRSPPVTRPAEFPAELSAWRSPAFTDSLSHAVVDTAPGGLVDGDGGGSATRRTPSVPAPELTLLPAAAADRRAAVGRARARRPRAPLRVLLPPSGRWPNPPLLRSPGHRRSACRSSTAPSSTTRPLNLVPEPLPEPASPEQVEPAADEASHRPGRRRPDGRSAGRSVRAAAGACRGDVTGAVGGGGRGPGRCNAAWTRRWRRPLHPTFRRLRSSRARRPLGLGAPLATAPVTAVPEPPADAGSDRGTATSGTSWRLRLHRDPDPARRLARCRPPRCRRPRPRCRHIRT